MSAKTLKCSHPPTPNTCAVVTLASVGMQAANHAPWGVLNLFSLPDCRSEAEETVLFRIAKGVLYAR